MSSHYVGTKTVIAQAMTRLAYNEYRGWALPADENGADEGYLVEYTDGGTPNHPDHAGYISWSPKTQFDSAYLSLGHIGHLLPHQQRVIAERVQLNDKITKLDQYANGPSFAELSDAEQARMRTQLDAMREYLAALSDRIASFS